MNKNTNKFNTFSIPLGLLDYGNPICYTITMILLYTYIYPNMDSVFGTLFLLGAILSILGGFIIPTGKVIVGMGLITFTMPVGLVFLVNSGILLTGFMLFEYIFTIPVLYLLLIIGGIILLLILMYLQSKKFNSVAVLTGGFGYLMIYISLICLSIQSGVWIPILFYSLAICLFLFLIGIGIKGNLKSSKTHWILEASNVCCQLFVALGTYLLLI